MSEKSDNQNAIDRSLISEEKAASILNDIQHVLLDELCEKYDLWKISIYKTSVTFMVMTRDEVSKLKKSEWYLDLISDFLLLVDPIDIKAIRSYISFHLDSKEFLDVQYKGNWYHYYH